MRTSSIVCRQKNSTAPCSPLILRVDVNEMSLVFFMFFWLRFEVSSFRAPQEDSPRQVSIDVFCLVLICFVDGGQFKRVILASVEVPRTDPAGGLFTLLLRMVDEPIT